MTYLLVEMELNSEATPSAASWRHWLAERRGALKAAYYDKPEPLRGLQVARMVGHMTYLSAEAMERKFGRRRRKPTSQFEIDSYLEYQGMKFSTAYDANSYIRVQAAMDEMDLQEKFGYLCGNPWDNGVVPQDQPYPWLWTPSIAADWQAG